MGSNSSALSHYFFTNIDSKYDSNNDEFMLSKKHHGSKGEIIWIQ